MMESSSPNSQPQEEECSSDHSDNVSFSDPDEEDHEDDEYEEGDVWDAETEVCLFESIGKMPPVGVNKHLSILNSAAYLQKYSNKHVTEQQVLEHLKELYNLDALQDDMNIETNVVDFSLPEEYTPFMEQKLAERSGFVFTPKTDSSSPSLSPSLSSVSSSSSSSSSSSPQLEISDTRPTRIKIKQEVKETRQPSKRQATSKLSSSQQTTSTSDIENNNTNNPSNSPHTNFAHIKNERKDESSYKNNGNAKYSTFSEFVYSAIQALGGSAELQALYVYCAEHSTEVDKKYSQRFEGGKQAGGYKSNVRSTLHNNQCFIRLANGQWTINPASRKQQINK